MEYWKTHKTTGNWTNIRNCQLYNFWVISNLQGPAWLANDESISQTSMPLRHKHFIMMNISCEKNNKAHHSTERCDCFNGYFCRFWFDISYICFSADTKSILPPAFTTLRTVKCHFMHFRLENACDLAGICLY